MQTDKILETRANVAKMLDRADALAEYTLLAEWDEHTLIISISYYILVMSGRVLPLMPDSVGWVLCEAQSYTCS